jgi:hypothetical protein
MQTGKKSNREFVRGEHTTAMLMVIASMVSLHDFVRHALIHSVIYRVRVLPSLDFFQLWFLCPLRLMTLYYIVHAIGPEMLFTSPFSINQSFCL